MASRTPSFADDETVSAGPEGGVTLERAPGQRLGAPAETAAVEPETVGGPRRRATVLPERALGPAPGAKVGRFTVLERLGAGGMGVVFAAYDPKLDRRVALKLLRGDLEPEPDAEGDGDAEVRLLREAQAMARVSHPNVIPVFEVGAFAGQVYVAMEYVAGATLRLWLMTPREQAAVLEVFEQAGRGLAAAHAAGLVHRDFKPANVMIGDDGRVRVLDFGLARPLHGTVHDDLTEDERGEVVLDAQITRTGVAMGTPAYMAPEQIEPEPVLDAKSDQFAFCVALYEALCGQPPFSGTTLTARLEQIRRGAVREPPPDRKLPRAVRDALVRGLSASPAARFESMDALLAALRPRASRRRGVVVGGVGAVAVAGLVGWGLWQGREAPAAPCRDAAEPFERLWTEARQGELAQRFRATGATFAAASWDGVASRVDAYVARGSALRVAACEATRVAGTQSEALLDLRMACLDRGRRELGALLDAWSRADSEVVATAVRSVGELPELEPCERLDALLQGVVPPEAAIAASVEAGRERLATLRAEERVGHYRAALPAAEAALLELAGVPYPPLHAEAVLVVGRLRLRLGKYEAARTHLERAYDLALSQRHDEIALEAAGTLALLFGEHLTQHDEGLAWVRHGDALLERSGGSMTARRNLVRLRGLLHIQNGELEQALALLQESLREAEEELGPDDYETGMAHHNLGNVLSFMGRAAEARTHYQRAQAVFEALAGPDHPDVAQPMHGLADLLYDEGDLDGARALYERAHEIRVRALGADHLLVAFSLSRLAVVATRQRRLDDALALAQRSVDVASAELGPDALHVARLLNNLGMAQITAGKLADAERTGARVLAIFEQQLPPTHHHLLKARSNMGTLLYERGDHEGALAITRRVLDVQEQTLEPDDPVIADTLDKLGVMLVALRRFDEAVSVHERALAIRQVRQGPEHVGTAETLAYLAEALVERGDAARAAELCERLLALEGRFEAPDVLANGRFLLAQARWALGERARAREEAARARTAYMANHQADRAKLVDEWLAAR